MSAIWLDGDTNPVDFHVGFHSSFVLDHAADVTVRVLAPSWATLWMDGAWLLDAPVRYAMTRPVWTTAIIDLSRGEHRVAVHAHHAGVDTGPMAALPAFLRVEVVVAGQPVELSWRAQRLAGYTPQAWRLNPQLGWGEVRAIGADNEFPGRAPVDWPAAVAVAVDLPDPSGDAAPPDRVSVEAGPPAAAGIYQERFLEVTGQHATTFHLRDRASGADVADGRWWRFDLGRVRLGHPRVEVSAPAGTQIELGYAETLTPLGLNPAIALSNGPSANMDRYVTRAGRQVLGPVTPRGGRFVEVHADHLDVEVHRSWIEERRGLGAPTGSFHCSDPLLDEIWAVGVETLAACTEDAVIDCPTRERGQWLGDVLVALEVAASAHGDLAVIRRAILTGADSADANGFVPALFPGRAHLLPAYAALWVSLVMRYVQLTADRTILVQAGSAAHATLEAFGRHIVDGTFVPPNHAWSHLDWGYRMDGSDLGMDLLLLRMAQDARHWAHLVADAPLADRARKIDDGLRGCVVQRLQDTPLEDMPLQQLVLAVDTGLLPGELGLAAGQEVVVRLAHAHPRAPGATRLSGAHVTEPSIATPFFAHFALPMLCEQGLGLDAFTHIRQAWGWMLEMQARTWFEVFDDRWSQCHVWSATPTRVLTQFGLGLRRRGDRGPMHWEVHWPDTDLDWANGQVPVPGSDSALEVSWQRQGTAVRWTLRTDTALCLEAADGTQWALNPGEHRFAISGTSTRLVGSRGR